MENFLEIGKIINTKGLDGTLKILPLTDDVKRFLSLKSVLINNVEYKVLKKNIHNNFAYLKLDNVNLECAQNLKNYYVSVNRNNATKLKKNEYFVVDLLNLKVYLNNDTYLGILTDIDNFGSADVYTVKDNNKEYTFCLVDDLILEVLDDKIILNAEKLKEVLV